MGGAAPQVCLVSAPAAVMVHTGKMCTRSKCRTTNLERDHTQLLPQEADSYGCAVTFEFTADAFDPSNHIEEDKYTAERIFLDKPHPNTSGSRL